MEYQKKKKKKKKKNRLDNISNQSSTYRTKKWFEINDDTREIYDTSS